MIFHPLPAWATFVPPLVWATFAPSPRGAGPPTTLVRPRLTRRRWRVLVASLLIYQRGVRTYCRLVLTLEVDHGSNLDGHGPGEMVHVEVQVRELGQLPNLPRYGALDAVVVQVEPLEAP